MADYSIMVPVYNETDALSFSKFHFDSLNLRPIYVLDSKRIARRDEVERAIGGEALIYDNPGMFLEANFEKFASLSPTDWILRIDCDEVVTAALIDHAGDYVKHGSWSTKGYCRRQLRWHEDGFQYVKYLFHRDTQFRLFDRRKVRFVRKIHTPGYDVPRLRRTPAPSPAHMYHLQFLFETPQQREKKGELYKSQGQPKKLDSFYTTPVEQFNWAPLDDPHLASTYRAWREVQGSQ